MNILFCGDDGVTDGIIISTVSILKNIRRPIHIHILTLDLEVGEKHYRAIPEEFACHLDSIVKRHPQGGSVTLYDLTDKFTREPPTANLNTSFTPPCMLRLFADEVEGLPSRLLYLDTDVVCRGDFSELYDRDLTGVELVGVLDHYGRHFFRARPPHQDYINSGVLLINLDMIRKTGLFRRAREMCRTKKMFMPDQSALNKLSEHKEFAERKYNEQRELRDDTVFRHFTTHFRFFPVLHPVKVKPWEKDRMHKILKLYEFDGIIAEYERERDIYRRSLSK